MAFMSSDVTSLVPLMGTAAEVGGPWPLLNFVGIQFLQ